MTRKEHLKWCKERAIQEYDYYKGADKQRNGLGSMMSDLSKHPETNNETLRMLCITMMLIPMNRQEFIDFLNGFN